jgi:hypothetical protein
VIEWRSRAAAARLSPSGGRGLIPDAGDEAAEILHRLHPAQHGAAVGDERRHAADTQPLGVPLVGEDARLELTTLERLAQGLTIEAEIRGEPRQDADLADVLAPLEERAKQARVIRVEAPL